MIRGESKIFRFKLPCNCDNLVSAKIVFGQSNNNGPSSSRPLPIIKTISHRVITQEPTHFCVMLSSEETLRFSDKMKAYVQFFGKTDEGVPILSPKSYINVYPIVDEIFDDDIILPTPTPDEWIYLDGSTIV